MTFGELKEKYDQENSNTKAINCILPVHTAINKIETNLYKKNGEHNEQYYKWQFMNCFIQAGLCSKDYIGVEVQFPKGNKSSAPIKLDGAIFDNKDWFIHYKALHSKKDDTRWDELNWLKEHLLCGIEFKKEDSKDVKGVFNSQLKSYMNESSKNTVFGILYDEGRLYLFKSNGKNYFRLSDEFNTENKGKLEITFDIPDPYSNLLSFDEMINYDIKSETVIDYSGRQLSDLSIISKTDSKRLNDALYQILHTMDKCGLVKQKGYNILIQLLALKIYDEKKNSSDLKYYINPNEQNYKNLSDDSIQDFLTRIEKIRKEAKTSYQKILNENYFDSQDESQVKLVIEIVKQFQNYSFTNSERNNLYQLVFYKFASEFSKTENAQFVTPLQIIDFIVDIIHPKHNESIIDPTIGIADFLSVSYVKSEGKLDDNNFYGITNIDNIIFYNGKNIQKSIFIHLMLDLYRSNNFIKKIGINGSGAESVTQYQIADIPIPDFPSNKEALITKLYSNSNAVYNCSKYSLDNFLEYDNKFNKLAGIYEIDKSMKLLQERLNNAIDNIANDKEVEIMF